MEHVPDPYAWHRRPTRRVAIGEVGVGGAEPIRVQSMTTSFTHDVDATIAQTAALVAAGCEIVRWTVPTNTDVMALPKLREAMKSKGLRVPIVADIHFSPKHALAAADWVEKVRVNPGNYADSKRFEKLEYSDAEYDAELGRLEERFAPLVEKCQQRGVAMRIGTNHGSLSDRILNRFGDTPLGMVESALEFVRICRRLDYHEIVLSMKASNVRVMVAAYRLLAGRMTEEGMDYPFHLGVTEAGDGVDGRLKSAAGIGALLEDGIGDTVRVSLTEDPVREVPVGFDLVARYNARIAGSAPSSAAPAAATTPLSFDPFDYARRVTRSVAVGPIRIGEGWPVRVEVDAGRPPAASAVDATAARLAELGTRDAGRTLELASFEVETETELRAATAIRDAVRALGAPVAIEVREARPGLLLEAQLLSSALAGADRVAASPPAGVDDGVRRNVLEAIARAASLAGTCWLAPLQGLDDSTAASRAVEVSAAAATSELEDAILDLDATDDATATFRARRVAAALAGAGSDLPILIRDRSAFSRKGEAAVTETGLRTGSVLVDGIGDAIRIELPGGGLAAAADAVGLGYDVLQSVRLRSSKTEYISCPSCGRTLFDLETTTARIKDRTGHLVGVKIAVMGCIVNGLGEMADADFGYVGWKPDRVNLFVGKECVENGVPEADAADRLVELIKREGMWTEPPASDDGEAGDGASEGAAASSGPGATVSV